MSNYTNTVVVLDRGNYTTCTVHLHGGTILSYRVRNKEILYMKQKTNFNNISPIRGGIKFTFPYFGRRINGPKHGFARYVPWKLEKAPFVRKDGNVEAVFYLEQTEYTKAIWNYKFKLSFKLVLCLTQLEISVKVENTCSHFPFLFNIMRHSIFRTEDVRKVRIRGLSHCQYYRFNPKTKVLKDPDPNETEITVKREFLDVYLKASPVVEVNNIDSKGLNLRITAHDTNATDVLLYNPWMEEDHSEVPDDSQHLSDEYLYCLGVGNGHIHSEIRLEPKESWEAAQIIEVINEEYNKKIEKYQMLLNNPWDLFQDKCNIVHTT